MRIGDAVARVAPDTLVKHAILAITKARAGAAVVVDTGNRVVGIFVDGDLRRGIEMGPEFLDTPVGNAMSSNCTIVKCGVLAGQVLDMMREKRIADVPVVDDNGCLLGVADLKGLVASM